MKHSSQNTETKTAIPGPGFSYSRTIHRVGKMGYTNDCSAGPLGDCPTKEPKESLDHLTYAVAVRPT